MTDKLNKTNFAVAIQTFIITSRSTAVFKLIVNSKVILNRDLGFILELCLI